MNMKSKTPRVIFLKAKIPLQTPKGNYLANIIVDYGADHGLLWLCTSKSGCVSWHDKDVKLLTKKKKA